MNLWVNRIGQLLTLAVALIFLSCHEEISVLGYRNPNSKFKVSYVELPIESSVMLRDSLRTSNFFFTGEANRFLIGSYVDDKFGTITSNVVTQYFTTTQATLGAGAIYDSVSLQLQFDFYHYGSTAKTQQAVSVYELEKDLTFDSLAYYFNRSSAPGNTLLGATSYTVDTEDLDDFATSVDDADTVITVTVPLEYSFGEKIFNSAIAFRDGVDTTFVTYSQFIEKFKGIVIKSDYGDKIVGFTPTGSGARLFLHYHTATDTLSFPIGMNGVIGFNQISANRAGTPLQDITQYHAEFLQESDSRYIQTGTGIVTKLDFSNFYAFVDTIPNILINSAELVVESVESSDFAPPSGLVLRNINPSTNRFRKFNQENEQDSIDLNRYRGQLSYDIAAGSNAAIVDNDNVFYAHGDRSPLLAYSSSKDSYSSIMTLFFQQLSIRNDDRSELRNFVLHPTSEASNKPAFQSGLKSLNRTVFPKSGIKLKIYYTKPLTAQ